MSLALVESEPFGAIGIMNPAGEHGALGVGGFTRLLERLHPDAEAAGEEYERLRARLVKFFDWRGVAQADECADEVLDRLARKLEHTTIQDVQKYVYGIARLVALERSRAPRFTSLDDALPETLASPAPPEGTDLQDCFDRCLAELPEDGRLLLLQYYEGERQAKIANRRRLASSLGISENALRLRAHRMRETLERSVQSCTSTSGSLTS